VTVDALEVVLPGAQSLVNAILTDGWTQARGALARRWSKQGSISRTAAEQRLDAGHEQSLVLAGEGEGQRARLEMYWAGYLAGLATDRAELLDVIRELAASPASAARTTTVRNSNTGNVRTLLQLGDAHGGISIGS
jgi:hypothetical protein